MQNYTEDIFNKLKDSEEIYSTDLSIPKDKIHGVLMALSSREQIYFEIIENFIPELTQEGKMICENGSYEFNLFNSIPETGLEISEISSEYQIGQKHAFKNKWIRKEGSKIYKNVNSIEDEIVQKLKKISISDKNDICNKNHICDKNHICIKNDDLEKLKKRNLIKLEKENIYLIKRGKKFFSYEKLETELTVNIINNFKDQKFKPYNFDSLGNIPNCGSLHPLMKVREEFKKIFLEMGFNEMATNSYVESSFWNFDSLFQPQNHPSRDAHDTFFLKTPEFSEDFDMDYLEKVRKIHSEGGMGSTGHQSEWKIEEAKKNILRTHTTAISSRYLKAMAESYNIKDNDIDDIKYIHDIKDNLQNLHNLKFKVFKPIKLFSIDKVFRNETVDATHLAEFHQVEGLIAGYNLGLGHLMGVLNEFFNKLGLKNIKFKPAFNPYTEPSMEIFGFHEGLQKWIEIGNSGIFRPEMLGPMGYPEDVTVIAWGLSLERPTMIKYGCNNIRDLVGHKVDLEFVKKSEFVFF